MYPFIRKGIHKYAQFFACLYNTNCRKFMPDIPYNIIQGNNNLTLLIYYTPKAVLLFLRAQTDGSSHAAKPNCPK